jgi:hypothetical protein
MLRGGAHIWGEGRPPGVNGSSVGVLLTERWRRAGQRLVRWESRNMAGGRRACWREGRRACRAGGRGNARGREGRCEACGGGPPILQRELDFLGGATFLFRACDGGDRISHARCLDTSKKEIGAEKNMQAQSTYYPAMSGEKKFSGDTALCSWKTEAIIRKQKLGGKYIRRSTDSTTSCGHVR